MVQFKINTLKREDEPVLLEDTVILDIAKKSELTPAQVLLSWAIDRGTSVVPKSVNPERLKQNLAAVEVSLGEQNIQVLNTLDKNRRYMDGSIWENEGGVYTVSNIWDE